MLTVFMSSHGAPAVLGGGPRGRLPSYSFPENAALRAGRGGALRPLARAARGRARSALDAFATRRDPRRHRPRPRRAPTAALADAEDAGHAPARRRHRAAPRVERTSPDRRRRRRATRLGYPLVAKAIAPGAAAQERRRRRRHWVCESPRRWPRRSTRWRERMHAAGMPLEGVLLQREVAGGIEALVGVTTDPTFGPLVVCGSAACSSSCCATWRSVCRR